MKVIMFNDDNWNKSLRKATILKYIILLLTLLLSLVIFGIRDSWFTPYAVYLWFDYILYLVLTIGVSVSSVIKNYILKRSRCFTTVEVPETTKEEDDALRLSAIQSASFSWLISMLKGHE